MTSELLAELLELSRRLEGVRAEIEAITVSLHTLAGATAVDLDAPIEQSMADLLSMTVMGVRLHNSLRNEHITTLRELLAHHPHYLMRLPNFGKKTLRMLQGWLTVRGLELKKEW
jgi:DNA-directed RNA polymerase alpha subunit